MKSIPGETNLTIGQLAARFGLATHVLRHWEAVGLLTPAARVSGQRRYQKEHIARVAMIVHGKRVGFSLAEIRQMVEAPDPAARRAILEEKSEALEQMQQQIDYSRAMIEHAVSCPAHDVSQCPNFQRMIDVLSEGGTVNVAELGATCAHSVPAAGKPPGWG
jgi:DNA-binding transcriptional MerR regulator